MAAVWFCICISENWIKNLTNCLSLTFSSEVLMMKNLNDLAPLDNAFKMDLKFSASFSELINGFTSI